MGYGHELYFDIHSDIETVQQDVYFKMDDLKEIQLFTVTKNISQTDGTTDSYTSKFDE